MNASLAMTVRRALRHGVWASALATSAVIAAPLAQATEEGEHTRMTQSAQAAMESGAQIYASPAQVRMVQEKLKEQGRTPGPVDGVWGDGTRTEVRDFQRANGLAPTGQLDTSLLSALDIGHVLKGQTQSSAFLDGLLRGEGARAKSEPAQGRGAPIYVSPEHIAQIQHLLREEGMYSGNVDGVWGEATAEAANKYRRAQGLEAHDGVDLALLRALNREGKALPQLSSKLAANAQGVPLEAGPAAIRALQRHLSDAGHDAGDVDGEWGENTRQAVREFQRKHELEATGSLTLPTLAALGLEVTAKPGEGGIGSQAQREGERMSEEEQDAVATTDADD